MLRVLSLTVILIFTILPLQARTNSEIGNELYKIANNVKEFNIHEAEKMKDNIASFLIDINIIGFNEDQAQWHPISNYWSYDKKSLNKFHLRYIGVYKSNDNKIMGVFDLNCEDINDVQNKYFGYVNTTEVYFSNNTTRQKGHSKGFYKTFCK